jgi:hypothetical protein
MSADSSQPGVSVILAVRNGGADLPKAIDTILVQTFTSFELIAIDDASTDGTGAFLDAIEDPRVRVYHHEKNAGLAASLNHGISLARGRYIARQDHDDLALPSRIGQQVKFLDANPDCGLIGTRAEIWVADRQTSRFHDHPTDHEALRSELLFNNPFVHSSVMIRKSALDRVGVYTTDPMRQPPEDYELWSRIARHYRVANLPERLTIYREVTGSISRAGEQPFLEKLVVISSENLAMASGTEKPQQVHIDMAALIHGASSLVSPKPDFAAMCAVLDRAVRSISGDNPSEDMLDRLTRAKDQLRHRLMLRQQPALGYAWRAARAVRNRLRRLIPYAR